MLLVSDTVLEAPHESESVTVPGTLPLLAKQISHNSQIKEGC